MPTLPKPLKAVAALLSRLGYVAVGVLIGAILVAQDVQKALDAHNVQAQQASLRDLVVAQAFAKSIEEGKPLDLPKGMNLSPTEFLIQASLQTLTRFPDSVIDQELSVFRSLDASLKVADDAESHSKGGRLGRMTAAVIAQHLPAFYATNGPIKHLLGVLPKLSGDSCDRELSGYAEVAASSYRFLTSVSVPMLQPKISGAQDLDALMHMNPMPTAQAADK